MERINEVLNSDPKEKQVYSYDFVEMFLREIITFRRSSFRNHIKPNRTLENHEKLRIMMAKVNIYIVPFYSVISAVTFMRSLLQVFDKEYIHAYPGCDDHLEMLDRQHKLPRFSLTLHRWRVITLLVDWTETFIVNTTMGFTVYFVVLFSIILNHDLNMYSNYLQKEAEKVLHGLQLISQANGREDAATDSSSPVPSDLHQRPLCERRVVYPREIFNSEGHKLVATLKSRLRLLSINKEFDDKVQRLQIEFEHFFREIRSADLILSDIITFGLLIWLTSLSVYTYLVSRTMVALSNPFFVVVVLLQLVNLIAVCLAGLKIHRHCTKTYPILCSIIAFYSLRRENPPLTIILDLYNDRKTCFKLFGCQPFLPTTLLSIFGWSVSCAFIIHTLTKK